MTAYKLGNGSTVRLGKILATAGEGRVADVEGHPNWVAKVFHTTFNGVTSRDELRRKEEGLGRKREKVGAMVQSKPDGWRLGNGHVVLAWPEEVLLEGGVVAGFVMPKIKVAEALEIHQITSASDRANPMPSGPQWGRGFNFRYLSHTAMNLASAVETAHSGGAVIGDFNERNILVAETTQVSLVDCDSMQFARNGRTYLCEVGRPEYTAPELQGRDLRSVTRTQASDLFALAVHIYMLLLDGAHPFQAGDWQGRGERPGAVERIKKGYYSGGPKSPVKPMRTAPPPEILPQDLRDLVERALGVGATDPSRRPQPHEWRSSLEKMIKAL